MHIQLNWDDLRLFLVAARTGSFTGASSALGLDTATVGRRVSRLESQLRCTLFSRSPAGLQLTATGAELLEHGLVAEAAIDAAASAASGDRLTGTVRLSASEGFGVAILAPALAELSRLHPKLRIQLAATAGFLSPDRREVDMAITLARPTSHRVVSEPLASYQLALYAAPDHPAARTKLAGLEDIRSHPIVGYIDDLLYAPELRYLAEIDPTLSVDIASSSIQAQRSIIAAGGGIGVLPCFLAEGLVRLLPDQVLITRQFWLGALKELHDSARHRAVRRWLHDLATCQAGRLEPYTGQDA